MCFSERKCDFFEKIAGGSKFVVGCKWINKTLQNLTNLDFLSEKKGFFEKKLWIFFQRNR